MAVHASHAALPYPVKNARFTLLVPFLDADGDPVDPTTPDTEISKDDGSAADTAEEIASPKNSVGMITLTGAETDCSCLSLAFKAASGPKTTLATLYPRVLPVIFSGTASAGAAGTITLATDIPAIASLLNGCIVKTTGGTGGGGTGGANNQARVITAFTTGRVASVSPNWETTPDNTTTYEVLLTEAALMRYSDLQLWRGQQPNALASGRVEVLLGAVTNGVIAAASFASNALDAVWSATTRLLSAGTNIVLAKGTGVTGFNDLSAAQVNAEADTALADVGLTSTITGRIDVATSTRLASGSYVAPLDAAGTRSAVGLASANLDTQLSAIDTKTTNLPSDPADQSLIIAATNSLAAAIAALNNVSAADVLAQVNTALTTAVADSVPADGSRPSIAQAAYMNTQFLLERTVTGTTLTVKKPDGSTTLFTITLNDATTPTSLTRAA